METHHPDNVRLKHRYYAFLKEAKRQSEDSVDAAAMAIDRFEAYTGWRDFKAFGIEQAMAFKARLAEQDSEVTGEKLSKATQRATLANLKRFFQWVCLQPGYKSRLNYTDTEYFNFSLKDSRVATASRPKPFPTIEQVTYVLGSIAAVTEIERRDRALIAFTLLTGARDGALASFKLKHVDLLAGSVYQDAREVRTKFSKSFTTFFMPVGGDARQIVEDWVGYLRTTKLWGNDDPLFPASLVAQNADGQFVTSGLDRAQWSTGSPIRAIFKRAFEGAELPYFNPHSFRHTLMQLGETLCRNAEAFKAWSQNMGHEGVLTSLTSYGTVAVHRQGEIIKQLALPATVVPTDKVDEIAEAVVRAMRKDGLRAAAEKGAGG